MLLDVLLLSLAAIFAICAFAFLGSRSSPSQPRRRLYGDPALAAERVSQLRSRRDQARSVEKIVPLRGSRRLLGD